MKKQLLVASALIAAIPAAFAQNGNSRPQPVVQPHVIPLPADKPYPGTMQLRVDATDVARGIFRVRQTIPVAKPGKLTLLYPEWLPGKHAPRGAIAEMAGFKPSAGGKPLAWTRQPTDVYAFDVDVPAGVKSIDVTFDFLSPTRTSEGRVVVTPAMMNLQWEQVSLYPAGYFTRQIPVQLEVTLPDGWTGAAALDGLKISGNRYSFAPTNYEVLVDSPMFAGRHFRKWDLGQNVTLNVVADEAKYLDARPDHIARHAALVSETVALFGSRPFDRYEFLLALTDEMGGIGLEHHRSSENSRSPDYFTQWDENDHIRGLLPHELVHSWNGKYRRPINYGPPISAPRCRAICCGFTKVRQAIGISSSLADRGCSQRIWCSPNGRRTRAFTARSRGANGARSRIRRSTRSSRRASPNPSPAGHAARIITMRDR